MPGLGNSGGGGSNAGAIEAGKAYVALGVKDLADADLKRLGKQFAQFGEDVSKKLGGGAAGELFGAKEKGIGTLGLAAVTLGFRELVKYADAFAPAITEARRQMDAIEGAAKSAAFQVQRMNADFERARGLAEPGKQGAVIDKQIAAQDKALKNQDEAIRQARELAEQIGNRGSGTLLLRDQILGGDTKAEFKEALEAADRLGDARAEMDRKLAELRRQRATLLDPFKNPEFLASFRGLGQEIKDAVDPAILSMGELEKKVLDLSRANKEAGEAAKARIAALAAEAKAADEAVRNREINKAFDDLNKQMRRMIVDTDPFRIRGDFEKRAQNFAEDNSLTDEGRRKLIEDAKKLDERIKRFGIDKQFADMLTDANIAKLSVGLSPENQQLAALVKQGFTNDQIQQLRRVGQEIRQSQGGTTTAGGLASSGLANALGVASGWQQEMELTNKKLDEIRLVITELQTKLGFK